MTSTGHLIPRSSLRYRPISSEAPDVLPWIVQASRQASRRASRTLTRPRSLSKHGQSVSHADLALGNTPMSIIIGASMCLTLLGIVLGQSVLSGLTQVYDALVYGTPRTFQTNVFVGHEGASKQASHFIALNNQGQIEIIEFPGNDATHAHIYLGPLLTGPHADQVPVTLSFVDPHATHHPDMLVQVQDASMLFLNRSGTFQPSLNGSDLAARSS